MHKKHIFLTFYPHPDPLRMLQKSVSDVNFAVQNVKIMCAIMSAYLGFARMVGSGEILRDPKISFRDVCRRLRVSPASLNEVLEEELGVSGQRLLEDIFCNGIKN